MLPLSLYRILDLAGKLGHVHSTPAARFWEIFFGQHSTVDINDNAWSFSTLTPTGFPLEICWNSAADELRYTLEAGGPDTPPPMRLALTAKLLEHLEHPVSRQILQELVHFQGSGAVKYGAWVGVRHKGGSTAIKLYCEVPRSLRREGDLIPPGGLKSAKCDLDMVGVDIDTGRFEYYYRASGLTPRDLPQLLNPLGLESRAGLMIHAIETLQRKPSYRRLPGSRHGFSYSITPSGKPVFTFFLFAEDIFANDAEIRRTILGLGREKNWNTGFYKSLTLPLEHSMHRTTHGLFGITLGTEGEPTFSVGLPPPG